MTRHRSISQDRRGANETNQPTDEAQGELDLRRPVRLATNCDLVRVIGATPSRGQIYVVHSDIAGWCPPVAPSSPWAAVMERIDGRRTLLEILAELRLPDRAIRTEALRFLRIGVLVYSDRPHREYAARLRQHYAATGAIRELDGYGGPAEFAERLALADYGRFLSLVEPLDVESIFDCGCGTGSLLKYVMGRKTIVPWGIDYNEVALSILRTEVLPEYRQNFENKDWVHDEIVVTQDLCYIMVSLLRDRLEAFDNFHIHSRYVIFRECPDVGPTQYLDRFLQATRLTVREEGLVAGPQAYRLYGVAGYACGGIGKCAIGSAGLQ